MRRASGMVTVVLINLSLMGPGVADDGGLDRYAWQNRLVLAFAPATDDAALQRQRLYRQGAEPGWRERHLVLIELVPGRLVTANGADAPDLDQQTLRRVYGIKADAVTVLLVGKDGGEKWRAGAAFPNDELFAIIDAMPMRQQEMRQQ